VAQIKAGPNRRVLSLRLTTLLAPLRGASNFGILFSGGCAPPARATTGYCLAPLTGWANFAALLSRGRAGEKKGSGKRGFYKQATPELRTQNAKKSEIRRIGEPGGEFSSPFRVFGVFSGQP
jgi:hypothetical protein